MTALSLALLLMAAPAAANGQWAGRFKPAGNLSSPRAAHTATLLKDGRVLVVGGRGAEALVELATTDLYEPKKNAWKPGPQLATGRSGHTATLLDDGRVLIAGGVAHDGDRFVALASCELFDPKTGKFTPAGSMAEARNVHSATRLEDGRVLVAGGVREQRGTVASAEIYDPRFDTWAPVPRMNAPRSGHKAVLLPGGDVLVTGGREVKTLSSTERYSPSKNTWSAGPELRDPRQHHAALLLPDGRVMVVGGVAPSGLTNLCELWKPGAATWTLAEHSLSMAHASFAAVVLDGGDVLLTGGEAHSVVDTPLAQRFISSGQHWCIAGTMATSRKGHTATLLHDGRVLVAGGISAGINESSAEIWEAAKGACDEPPGIALEP